jgi:putative transposase
VAWKHWTTMDQRKALIDDFLSGMYGKAELAERYGVSRPTVNKWIGRFKQDGYAGLADRSSAPRRCGHRTEARIEELILEVRRKHPRWGARKILAYIDNKRSGPRPKAPFNLPAELVLPARSTANDLLGRHGMLQRQSRAQRPPRRSSELTGAASQAGECYFIDFKGHFRMGNGRYCYGLTMTDADSRMLLVCEALPDTGGDGVRRVLECVFSDSGLPERIHSDNGTPFSSTARCGLSRLNIWWTKLGITHELSRPGCPQDNPQHERMHRTMKAETTRPPEHDLEAQQRRFGAFREEFNHERPHEALGGRTPSMLWTPSLRPLPESLASPEYAGHFEVRRVTSNGVIKFRNDWLFLSETLEGESVALEEIDDGIWSVWFYRLLLGRYDERSKRFC